MILEIERKFLVLNDDWRQTAGPGTPYIQGYLSGAETSCSIRVRLEGGRAVLGIKKRLTNLSRKEFEYEIPADDARDLLTGLNYPPVEKIRYRMPHEGHIWEIDEFKGANAGLVLAEIELNDEGEAFARPDWLGKEVTADDRYLNVSLAIRPYTTWPEFFSEPIPGGSPRGK